jgi:isoleucyl-tRNA synthetase
MNVLWNVKNYLIELANSIGKNPEKIKPTLGLEEKYILSRCNSTIKEVTKLFDEYRLDETVEKIESLFLDLSRGYIQLIRDKASIGSDKEKEAVLYTVYEVLLSAMKLFAPTCPFLSEAIYQDLRKLGLKEESIHLCEWPKYDEKIINKKLEEEFGFSREVIERALAERSAKGIGVRWPLASINVKTEKKISEDFQEIILRQGNAKKIKFESGKVLEVQLDTKMSPELEAEGFSREVTRLVQDARKQSSLKKEQKIKLAVDCDKNLESYLKKFEKSIIEKVNTSKIEFSKKKMKNVFEKKIKDKNIVVSFDVI